MFGGLAEKIFSADCSLLARAALPALPTIDKVRVCIVGVFLHKIRCISRLVDASHRRPSPRTMPVCVCVWMDDASFDFDTTIIILFPAVCGHVFLLPAFLPPFLA